MAAFPDHADTVLAGELEIRLGEGLVLATGRALTLSVREFELLAAMARRIGAIITREELYATVWGGDLRAGDRSVDIFVSRIRLKLRRLSPDWSYLHTHVGVGYRFEAKHEAKPSTTPASQFDDDPTDAQPAARPEAQKERLTFA